MATSAILQKEQCGKPAIVAGRLLKFLRLTGCKPIPWLVVHPGTRSFLKMKDPVTTRVRVELYAAKHLPLNVGVPGKSNGSI